MLTFAGRSLDSFYRLDLGICICRLIGGAGGFPNRKEGFYCQKKET